MNTSKQVNVMIGLMFLVLIGTFLYFIWDNVRADDAEQRQLVQNAERGGKLFSLNCRSCHGLNGLGSLENTLLPGLPLNLEANRPMMADPDDPGKTVPDPGKLMEIQSRFRDTIRCGRLGTLMPAWAEDQGGPLNDFQIDQLIALITGSMQGLDLPDNLSAISEKGWEAAVEEADNADLLRGKKLAAAVGAVDTIFVLTDVGELTAASLLRIDDEVVRIVDISMDNDEITVERADFQTQAAEHEEGAQVFTGPIEPPTGPFIEVACGQTQRAPAPSGTPPPAATPAAPGAVPTPSAGQPERPASAQVVQAEVLEPSDSIIETDSLDNSFSLNNFQVKVGQEVTIRLSNPGLNPHNLRIVGLDGEWSSDDDFATAIIQNGETDEFTFSLDQPATLVFRCDVHPLEMWGQISVTE